MTEVEIIQDEDVKEFYNELVKHYSGKLANPEHYPNTFQYQVKVFKYLWDRKQA